YGDTNTLYTRLGARLSKNWELANRYQLTTWARVNLWHAFGGNEKTSFPTVAGGPGTMKSDLGGTWGSVDVGVSGQVSTNMRLFASATYNASLDSGKGHSIGGRLGVKYVW
ncbi:autotransporter domain-containing protein, partial [Microvirga sp. W0021]